MVEVEWKSEVKNGLVSANQKILLELLHALLANYESSRPSTGPEARRVKISSLLDHDVLYFALIDCVERKKDQTNGATCPLLPIECDA